MRAKSFFYVSLGILALALAYHLGATSAQGQVAVSNPVAAAIANTGSGQYISAVATANGNIYAAPRVDGPWHHLGNAFSGSTPAAQPTFGQLKAQYRK